MNYTLEKPTTKKTVKLIQPDQFIYLEIGGKDVAFIDDEGCLNIYKETAKKVGLTVEVLE